LAVAGAAAFSFSANAVPPAAVSAYLPTTCQPGVPGDCVRGIPVTNPDGTNIGGSSSGGTATSTSAGGSITTANTYQSVLAANTSRKGCLVSNTSANVELVYLGAPGSATSAASTPVQSGGSFSCASAGGLVVSDQISMTSSTAGSTFVVVSQ
jgi:hypothetical protein